MPPRSKVHQLPEDIRQSLEQRLIQSGFSDYQGLSDWLAEQGFEIARSSLHRFGQGFEERCAALKIATDQARAIVEASPDSEGAMGQALTRLVQEKIFSVLLDMEIDPEEVDISKLTRAIADLSRAAVSQQKHASEVRRAAREEMLAAQREELAKQVRNGGLSDSAAKVMREKILGIA
ncbi:DUF3486 family protein [Luteimonas sp. FXH3W]|uniref:DUF3486 family protein n=1 Tax=Aquilutibacter rugosus TaxID=3115820 RepID=A0ABU7UVP7_9GAMM